MYQFSYSQILADNVTDARAAERGALDKAVTLLQAAALSPPRSFREREALDFTAQLWGIFVKSLASDDNDLPDQLRAALISIGLGILAEVARIDRGESREFVALAEICGIIRDGLA